MAQTISPYSPEYAARYAGSAVGGLLGYSGTPVPFAPPTNGGAAGNAANPYREQQNFGSGSVQGAATSAAPDPFAQYGGEAAYNGLRSGYNTQKSNILSTTKEAIGSAGRSLGSSILDYLSQLRNQQQGIDRQGVDAELARQQGTSGVLGMVGRGIKSGGVQLSNRGSGSSSAAEALARAYGDIGRRNMSQVGNQYAQAEDNIATQQSNLQSDIGTFQRHYGETKQNTVEGIVSSARNQLASLDAAIAGASLPDRINIEQEKQRIQSEVEAALGQYDSQLSGGLAGVAPLGGEQRRAKATQLANAGTAAAAPFQYSATVPAQFQGTGPFASELPIFTNRRRTA